MDYLDQHLSYYYITVPKQSRGQTCDTDDLNVGRLGGGFRSCDILEKENIQQEGIFLSPRMYLGKRQGEQFFLYS